MLTKVQKNGIIYIESKKRKEKRFLKKDKRNLTKSKKNGIIYI